VAADLFHRPEDQADNRNPYSNSNALIVEAAVAVAVKVAVKVSNFRYQVVCWELFFP